MTHLNANDSIARTAKTTTFAQAWDAATEEGSWKPEADENADDLVEQFNNVQKDLGVLNECRRRGDWSAARDNLLSTLLSNSARLSGEIKDLRGEPRKAWYVI